MLKTIAGEEGWPDTAKSRVFFTGNPSGSSTKNENKNKNIYLSSFFFHTSKKFYDSMNKKLRYGNICTRRDIYNVRTPCVSVRAPTRGLLA
jgi:hypothetical protein